MSVLENIKQALNLLQENENHYSELVDDLSISDKKIDYWLHYIELNNVPVTQGYKIIKEIKGLREKRRIIKNDLELMKVFKENEQKMVNSKNRQLLLNCICKTDNKQQSAKYSYDAYTEEEINEILGIKKEVVDGEKITEDN